jgi:hypothetical protein
VRALVTLCGDKGWIHWSSAIQRPTYELLATVAAAIARAFAERVHEIWTHEESDGAICDAVFLRLP